MMHIERYGGGPDVFVCIHGWGGSHLTYAPLAHLVPASASLYALDLPGYGRSPAPAAWSADAIGDAVAAAVESIAARDVTIVGNCSGAVFGLIAAQRLPSRVERVVLIDAFAFVPWYFKVFANPLYGDIAYRSTFANPAGRWLTNASLRNRRAAETHLTDSFRDIDPAVSLRYLRMLDAIDGAQRFAGIRMPTDLLYGTNTFAAVKASIHEWKAMWPHARIWPLEGAGHLPLEETAGAVAAILFEHAAVGDLR